jgi:hypothetical protein
LKFNQLVRKSQTSWNIHYSGLFICTLALRKQQAALGSVLAWAYTGKRFENFGVPALVLKTTGIGNFIERKLCLKEHFY